MKNKYYYIFSTCIFVKGIHRGIIYDLQREDYDYVPNSLIDLFSKYNGRQISSLYKNFTSDDIETINDYISFLEEKEYIFCSNFKIDKNNLPPLEEEFKSPYQISNLIIDVSLFIRNNFEIINSQIEKMGCGGILLRVFKKDDFKYLKDIISFLELSSCRNIQIYVNNYENVYEDLQEVAKKNQRILNVVIYNSEQKGTGTDIDYNFFWYRETNILEETSSHKVYFTNFNVNTPLYIESLNYNTYYNRKIYINCNGDLKNSPESDSFFGNIINTYFDNLFNNSDFNYLWFIKKDDLVTCKLCEYRYMCVDARIPEFNKNLKKYLFNRACNYNPYTNQWKLIEDVE